LAAIGNKPEATRNIEPKTRVETALKAKRNYWFSKKLKVTLQQIGTMLRQEFDKGINDIKRHKQPKSTAKENTGQVL